MAVTLVQEGVGDSTDNENADLTFTGSIAAGELMVALLSVAHFTTYTITTVPSGWTVAAALNNLAFANEANWDVYLYTKLAGASEPLTHNWVTTGSSCIVQGARFSGVASATPDQTDTEYNTGSVTSLVEGTSPSPGANALWFVGWVSKHFSGSQVPVTFTDSGAAVTKEDQLTTTGGTKNESAWGWLNKNGTINITASTGATAVTGPRLLMAAFLEVTADTDIDVDAGTGDGAAGTIEVTSFGVLDLTAGTGDGAAALIEVTGFGVLDVTGGSDPGDSATVDLTVLPPPPPLTLVSSAAAGGNATIRLRAPSTGYDPGGADAVRRSPRPVR